MSYIRVYRHNGIVMMHLRRPKDPQFRERYVGLYELSSIVDEEGC
jgi:hypothetical protein